MKVIPKFFSEEECFNMIVNHRSKVKQAGVIGLDSNERRLVRNSKVYIWDHDVFLENKFQCTPMVFQFSEYSILNHYNWHDDHKANGTRRRIETCIVNLNKEYRGGEFELEQGIVELNVGDCLRFDSKLKHKVNPVLKGKRYSLTGWVYEPYSIEKILKGEEEFE